MFNLSKFYNRLQGSSLLSSCIVLFCLIGYTGSSLLSSCIVLFCLIGYTETSHQFVCKGILYGEECYWVTKQSAIDISELMPMCAEDGGNLTYFPNQHTLDNLALHYHDQLLGSTGRIAVGIVFDKTNRLWVDVHGEIVSWISWGLDQGGTPTNQLCTYMNWIKSQYNLRDTYCNRVRSHGLCGIAVRYAQDIVSIIPGRLDHHVTDSINSSKPTHCAMACYQRSTCQSCNYDYKKYTCELNNVTKEEDFLVNFNTAITDVVYISPSIRLKTNNKSQPLNIITQQFNAYLSP